MFKFKGTPFALVIISPTQSLLSILDRFGFFTHLEVSAYNICKHLCLQLFLSSDTIPLPEVNQSCILPG